MWATNLKVMSVVLGTIAAYTLIANAIPQIESEVPEELSFGDEVSAAELVAAGEGLYNGAGGCSACHGLGTRAPNLLTDEAGEGAIGQRCAGRVSGEDCKAYLYASLTDPSAFVYGEYEPIMPDMRRTLSGAQIWALVAFLEDQGGEVTVTGDDLSSAGESDAVDQEATAEPAGTAPTATADPIEIMREQQCFACHKLGEEGVQLGPSFDIIGNGRDAVYLRRAILEPSAEVAAGFEAFAGVMPTGFGDRMTAAQLEAVVTFLADRK